MRLKQFGQNAIIYAIGNIGLRVSSFLMIPLYTHYLSMSDFGLLATLLLTIQVLISIMELGITTAIMRFAGEYERKGQMSTLLGSSIIITIINSSFVSLIIISIAHIAFGTLLPAENIRMYIALSCGAATAQTLFMKILSYYRAKGQGVKFTTASISAAILLLCINWYFLVIIDQGIRGVLLAQIMPYGFAWIAFSIYIGITVGIEFSLISAKKIAVFGFPLVFAMVGHIAADTTAVYLLGIYRSLEEVAIFSLGHKIASITGIILILPFELAYEPFVYANKDRQEIKNIITRLVTYLMLFFAFVSMGVLYVFRPLFPLIAPAAYSPAYEVTILLFSGFAFLGLRGIGQSLLHIKNKPSVTGITISIYTMITILLQYFLIPKMGIFALVLTFNFMNISIGLTLMVMGIKQFAIKLERVRLLVITIYYIFFMMLGYELWSMSAYLFYSLIPAVSLLSIWVLYICGFFFEDEILAIRKLVIGRNLNRIEEFFLKKSLNKRLS